MPELDKDAVNQYWEQVTPTILGPYMMDGYGFPASAGKYRFGMEEQVVDKLIHGIIRDTNDYRVAGAAAARTDCSGGGNGLGAAHRRAH